MTPIELTVSLFEHAQSKGFSEENGLEAFIIATATLAVSLGVELDDVVETLEIIASDIAEELESFVSEQATIQ